MPSVIFEFMKKAKKVKIKRKETEKEKWKQNPENTKMGRPSLRHPVRSSDICRSVREIGFSELRGQQKTLDWLRWAKAHKAHV